MCTIDLSKAFDKASHHGLIKLMKSNLPVNFLEIIEHCLSMCYSVVKWNCVFICVWSEIWYQTGLCLITLIICIIIG